jgi:preprotein translocase subunit SecG
MGASVIGILAILAAVAGLIVWLLVWVMGGLNTMIIGFALVSLLMMLIILIQKPRGGGLAGAFGGAGGGAQSAFGGKTGDALTIATIVFFLLYISLAMGLTWATDRPAAPPVETETTAPAEDGSANPESNPGTTDQPVDTGSQPVDPTPAPSTTSEDAAPEASDSSEEAKTSDAEADP